MSSFFFQAICYAEGMPTNEVLYWSILHPFEVVSSEVHIDLVIHGPWGTLAYHVVFKERQCVNKNEWETSHV